MKFHISKQFQQPTGSIKHYRKLQRKTRLVFYITHIDSIIKQKQTYRHRLTCNREGEQPPRDFQNRTSQFHISITLSSTFSKQIEIAITQVSKDTQVQGSKGERKESKRKNIQHTTYESEKSQCNLKSWHGITEKCY